MTNKNFYCDHIGIMTKNAKTLVEFYIEKLGFAKEKGEILPRSIAKPLFNVDSDAKFIRLYLGEVKIEIFELPDHTTAVPSSRLGFHHWGFKVDDKDGYLKELKSKDVDIIEIDRDGHSVYFVKDPDQNLIEIR